jgi:hypothetical protein
MKKAIGLLATVLFICRTAGAEPLKDFKYGAKIEILSVTADNAVTLDAKTPPNDKFSDTRARVTLGASFAPTEEIDAVVTALKCDRQYDSTVQQTVAGGTIDAFKFYEAYLKLKGVLGIDHKVGKQFYGKAGDLVIYYGPSGWSTRVMSAASLEGWSGVWKSDKLTITGLAAKYKEGLTTTLTDKDIQGVNFAYDHSEIVSPSAYLYQSDDRNTAPARTNKLIVAGVKAEGKYLGIAYCAEYAMNMGSNKGAVSTSTAVDYNGKAIKLNAKYTLEPAVGKLEVAGEYAFGTGDKSATRKNEAFTTINANYKPGLLISGVGLGPNLASSLNKLENLTTWNAGLKFMPKRFEKLDIAGKYMNFMRTEGAANGMGSEVDLIATWNQSQNITLKAAYAMFMLDKDMAVVTRHDTVTLMDLYMCVKF